MRSNSECGKLADVRTRQILVTALLVAFAAGAAARELNGFTLEPASIDTAEIVAGGPRRDGIPALDHPKTAGADYAWPDDEIVLGLVVEGEARAYPISILVWHELVNDTLGGRPVLVSYCPLCGTGLVFDRRVGEGGKQGAREPAPRRFGVSGLLYRADLLMFDRETESLWSQISAEAVTGPSVGSRLRLLRSEMRTWAGWRARHPATRVLTRDTGHARDYGTSPYGRYAHTERVPFRVPLDPRYHPKMPTVGLRVPGGPARAYPAVEVVRAGGKIAETFAGSPVSVAYDPDAQVFEVTAPERVEVVEGYWFAWTAFHPNTSVATVPEEARR